MPVPAYTQVHAELFLGLAPALHVVPLQQAGLLVQALVALL